MLKTTSQIQEFISTIVQNFPQYQYESSHLFHESSKSFLIDGLISFINNLLSQLQGNILHYPRIYAFFDNYLIESNISRYCLATQSYQVSLFSALTSSMSHLFMFLSTIAETLTGKPGRPASKNVSYRATDQHCNRITLSANLKQHLIN